MAGGSKQFQIRIFREFSKSNWKIYNHVYMQYYNAIKHQMQYIKAALRWTSDRWDLYFKTS